MAAPVLDRLEAAIGEVTADQLVRIYLTRAALLGNRLPASDADDLSVVRDWLSGGVADMGARSLLGLTTDELWLFVADQLRPRRGRRRCVSTVYRRLLALRRFFEWAVAVGVADANPVPPERARG